MPSSESVAPGRRLPAPRRPEQFRIERRLVADAFRNGQDEDRRKYSRDHLALLAHRHASPSLTAPAAQSRRLLLRVLSPLRLQTLDTPAQSQEQTPDFSPGHLPCRNRRLDLLPRPAELGRLLLTTPCDRSVRAAREVFTEMAEDEPLQELVHGCHSTADALAVGISASVVVAVLCVPAGSPVPAELGTADLSEIVEPSASEDVGEHVPGSPVSGSWPADAATPRRPRTCRRAGKDPWSPQASRTGAAPHRADLPPPGTPPYRPRPATSEGPGRYGSDDPGPRAASAYQGPGPSGGTPGLPARFTSRSPSPVDRFTCSA